MMIFKKCFFILILFILLISISPIALGDTAYYSASTETELLGHITAINAAADTGNSEDSYIITVTNNITLQNRIYFHNSNVTIQGIPGNDITITRDSNFNTAQDIARGHFNPGMVEVAVFPDTSLINYQFKNASLILKNITFDDAYNPDNLTMTNKVLAGSIIDPITWNERIYDSILSAYHENVTITLKEGAHLKNPGGVSAIYITAGAKCIMEEGSTISGGKPIQVGSNKESFDLIRLLGINTHLEFRGEISGNGLSDADKIGNAIFVQNGTVDFYGNISNNYLGHAIQTQGNPNEVVLELYEDSLISHNNVSIGAVYVRGATVHINGTVSFNNNTGGDNGGGFYVGDSSELYLYNSGKILNNTVLDSSNGGAGGGVYLNNGAILTMTGGLISGNKAEGIHNELIADSGDYGGGGVSVVKDSKFIMDGGRIENNKATVGGGVYLSARENINGPIFEFNKGIIYSNIATALRNIPLDSSSRVYYGNDIAVGSGDSKPSNFDTGHYIQIGNIGGMDAFIGDYIGFGTMDTTKTITDKAMHSHVRNGDVIFFGGTLTSATMSTIPATTPDGMYTLENTFWVGKEAGTTSLNFGVSYPTYIYDHYSEYDSSYNLIYGVFYTNEYEYQFYYIPLDSFGNPDPAGQPEFLVPARAGQILDLNIANLDIGRQGYGIAMYSKLKADTFALDLTHSGNGTFNFSDGSTQKTLHPWGSLLGDSDVTVTATADPGWFVQDITFTTGDGVIGSAFTTSHDPAVSSPYIYYQQLATGTNTLHTQFGDYRTLEYSHDGEGQFYPTSSAPFWLIPTVLPGPVANSTMVAYVCEFFIEPAPGWEIDWDSFELYVDGVSVTNNIISDQYGNTFSPLYVLPNGNFAVSYFPLAPITDSFGNMDQERNKVHVVFKKINSSGGGSSSGSANIATGGGKLIETPKFFEHKILDEPVIPKLIVIQMWLTAIAVFVFVVWFEKNDED